MTSFIDDPLSENKHYKKLCDENHEYLIRKEKKIFFLFTSININYLFRVPFNRLTNACQGFFGPSPRDKYVSFTPPILCNLIGWPGDKYHTCGRSVLCGRLQPDPARSSPFSPIPDGVRDEN